MIDCIIVGQGIAGTVLAYTFLKKGKKVVVINDESLPSASQVAGGIFNPLTGKNLVKTWLADDLFPFLLDFYQDLENVLGEKFLHITPIYRPFRSVQEQNDWLAKSALLEYRPFVNTNPQEADYQNDIQSPFGGIETLQAGWLEVPKLLKAFRCFLEKKSLYFKEKFDYSALQIYSDKLIYKHLQAERIIFCEGTYALQNPFFTHLPFNFAKGEMIDIEVENATFESIVNQGVSLIPLGNSRYRVASTYSWEKLDWESSEKAKAELAEKARNLLKKNFSIVAQNAGVRPATKNRRPIIGLHPQMPQIGIFNGLGSKGVSLAPYLAEQFYKHIYENVPLSHEINQPS
ncbi:MAG: FAD-binding oxidoreductase [Raineya sp.]|nr:FAD-binding oxidoreductase [Raineya sp.]MDW8295388.1 FAD-binding oxidoreductase [Raineya sp.]